MAERSTEALHPSAADLHALSGSDVLACVLGAQQAALAAVGAAIPAIGRAADAAADTLRAGGKLAYVGAGSSGLMALADALELSGTFGIPPDRTPVLFAGGMAALLHMRGSVEDMVDAAAADLAAAGLTKGDVALCVSASGRTPYTVAIAGLCRAAGVTVAGIANVAGSPLLEQADLPIFLDTGPEVIAGSTRLGAASAQKVALNMISVLMGIRLGHVHQGMMVNVVADNTKLQDRAARIVSTIAGTDLAASLAALAACDWSVKPAILVARGSSAAAAHANLKTSGGHLSPWLEG